MVQVGWFEGNLKVSQWFNDVFRMVSQWLMDLGWFDAGFITWSVMMNDG